MIYGNNHSRNYTRERAKMLFGEGEFSHYVSTGDWGYYPSHWYWRKVDLRYRKPKDVK